MCSSASRRCEQNQFTFFVRGATSSNFLGRNEYGTTWTLEQVAVLAAESGRAPRAASVRPPGVISVSNHSAQDYIVTELGFGFLEGICYFRSGESLRIMHCNRLSHSPPVFCDELFYVNQQSYPLIILTTGRATQPVEASGPPNNQSVDRPTGRPTDQASGRSTSSRQESRRCSASWA